MNPSVLGIDLGDTFVRVRFVDGWSGGAPSSPDFARRPPLQFGGPHGDVPALLEVAPLEVGGIAAYGVPVQTRLRSGEARNSCVFGLRSGFAADPGRVGPLLEDLYRHLAVDLQQRILGQAVSAQNGWRIVVSVPEDWNTELRARYRLHLAAAFPGGSVHLRTCLEAALSRLAACDFPELREGAVVLCAEYGTGPVTLTGGELLQSEPWLAPFRSWRLAVGGETFDARFAAHLFGHTAVAEREMGGHEREMSRDCKEAFSQSLRGGQDFHLHQILPNGSNDYSSRWVRVDRQAFEEEAFAGGLIAELRRGLSEAVRELEERFGRVDAIAAWGGGANWPFVPKLLRALAPDCTPVLLLPVPEETVVNGLVCPPIRWSPPLMPPAPAVSGLSALENCAVEALPWLHSEALAQGTGAAEAAQTFLSQLPPSPKSLLADRDALQLVLERIKTGRLWLSLFGQNGVGKSAVMNSLVGEEFAITREHHDAGQPDRVPPGEGKLALQDTPWILGQPDQEEREKQAIQEARRSMGLIFVIQGIPFSDEVEWFDRLSAALPDIPRIVFVNKADRLQPPLMSTRDRDIVRRSIHEKMHKYVASDADIVYGSALRYDLDQDVMVRQELPDLMLRIEALVRRDRAEASRLLVRVAAGAEADQPLVPLRRLYDDPGLWEAVIEQLLRLAGRQAEPQTARTLAVHLLKQGAQNRPQDYLLSSASFEQRCARFLLFGEGVRAWIEDCGEESRAPRTITSG